VRRVLLDVNIILDVLLNRHPHAEVAATLWKEVEGGKAEGFLAAHAVTTIFYLANKARGLSFARQTVEDLLSVFRVAPVNEDVIRRAIALHWADFEDAVSASSAAVSNCGAIATRDPAGFRWSPVPVMEPDAAVAWLKAAED